MKNVVISGTGLFTPAQVISNAELVASYNAYADLQNERYAAEIAAGTRPPLVHSSVEFIEKASGIRQRYVIEKDGCARSHAACARTSSRGRTTSCR
jgi:beta-ketodecanoyl-[acyl-carrier-protein] synthase